MEIILVFAILTTALGADIHPPDYDKTNPVSTGSRGYQSLPRQNQAYGIFGQSSLDRHMLRRFFGSPNKDPHKYIVYKRGYQEKDTKPGYQRGPPTSVKGSSYDDNQYKPNRDYGKNRNSGYEKRPQASVGYGEPHGNSGYGDLQGNSGYGDPHGNSGYGDPHGNSGYGDPHGNSGYGDPHGNSGYGDPQGNSGYRDPHGNSGYGDPQSNSGYGDPHGNSGYGDPQGNSGYGDPHGNSGYGTKNSGYGDNDKRKDKSGYGKDPKIDPYGNSGYGNAHGNSGYGDPHGNSGYGTKNSGYGDNDKRTDKSGYGEDTKTTSYGNSGYGDPHASSGYKDPHGVKPMKGQDNERKGYKTPDKGDTEDKTTTRDKTNTDFLKHLLQKINSQDDKESPKLSPAKEQPGYEEKYKDSGYGSKTGTGNKYLKNSDLFAHLRKLSPGYRRSKSNYDDGGIGKNKSGYDRKESDKDGFFVYLKPTGYGDKQGGDKSTNTHTPRKHIFQTDKYFHP